MPLFSYVMFMAFHVLVGSSIHSVWSSLFVLTAEVVPEPKRVANGAVFNFGTCSIYYHYFSTFTSIQLWFLLYFFAIISHFFFMVNSGQRYENNFQRF
jgi:hypothetical protein